MRFRRAKEAYYDKPFESAAKWLLARGVHPNHFTFLQIPVFVVTIIAAVQGWNWPFVLMIAFIIVLDGGDGILARVGKLATKTGAVLDSTFDTLGIAVVMWGATKFFPAQEAWLMLLFLANTILYLQNALLGRKVVAYIRGPILAAVAFPAVLPGALVVSTFIVGWLVVVRSPASFQTLMSGKHPA